jgi:hypothetical protein
MWKTWWTWVSVKIVKREGKSEEKGKATKSYAFRSSAFLAYLSFTILGTVFWKKRFLKNDNNIEVFR